MSRIAVFITTDHKDHDEAVKSVSNAMKRAGYDFKDYDMHGFTVFSQHPENKTLQIFGTAHALVEVVEPEVSDRGN